MTPKDIIDLQLESFFGLKSPQKIQKLVDEELNRGRWEEGYHLAACRGVVSGEDARKLLQAILNQHPELRIDEAALIPAIERHLQHENLAWMVDESGAFALTDGLRVARFDGAEMTWKSPRISFDGIDFVSLTDGKLHGHALFLGSHEPPSGPFSFNFTTGELIEGQVIES